jgi:hypothetical protein
MGEAPHHPDEGPAFDVTEVGSEKRGWRLSLPPHRLRFDRGDGSPPFDVWRDQFPEVVQLLRRLRVLSVKLPLDGREPKSVLFQLEPETFEAVRQFIGPPTPEHLRVELKKRFSYALTIGIGFVVLAFLPTRGGPGAAGGRFDPYLLAIGAFLVLAGALSKLLPHRVFFLADAALFGLFAARSVERIVNGGGWLWWCYLALTAFFAFSNVRQFLRFAEMRPAPAPAPASPPPAPPPAV